MSRKRMVVGGVAVAAVLFFAGSAAFASSGGPRWISAGGDLQNTRSQSSEHKLTVDNVGSLMQKWAFTTDGDVSATPAVDGNAVYFPDWKGNLYAVNKTTGQQIWKVSISTASGVPFDKARATPTVTDDKVIIGTQGSILVPGGGPGAQVLAFNKNTGALLWRTQVDAHLAAIITQSATVFDDRVYVGVASQEEALAAFIHPYTLSFRGSMLALDVNTGAIIWKTYTAPVGYTGNAVWGSSPAIDTKRNQVYIGTGNNYSVPADVLQCVANAGGNPAAQSACLSSSDYVDSIMALDLDTGAVHWATRAIPYDAWTVDCIPLGFNNGSQCPQPAGPDFDFGQAPALFKVNPAGQGKPREMVGAGQKSGQYWALDPDNGAVQWVTQAGPGGTAGGLQWGSAVDGTRVYTANANSNHKSWTLQPGGTVATTDGVWSGLDAVTGQVRWQTSPPHGGGTSGPVTTANGIVFGCSLDPSGYMYALNGSTGAVLWQFASGGSCLSGAAISNGTLYWGSGYSNFGFGTPNNKVYAFGLHD